MSDLISRQAALDIYDDYNVAVENGELEAYRKHKNRLLKLPPVKPQSKTGHWIFDEILDKHYYCSECKSMGVDYWDFCPNCGARMVEPQERSDKE